MKIILVNATAIIEGGGLTILRQFINHIENDNHIKYYIFCSLISLKKEFKDKKNVIFHFPKAKKMFNRLLWDNFGINRWIKKNHINPDLFISMQNTGVNIDDNIPQIIYIHQAIPFVEKKWNYLKKEERFLWFYKNIYSYFIKQHLKKTKKVIVQAEWLKSKFSHKYQYPLDHILVIKPEINLINFPIPINMINIDKMMFNIFYPAYPFVYKNHIEIINALNYLNKEKKNILKIKIYFTFLKEDNPYIYNKIIEYALEENFIFLGKITFQEVVSMYQNTNLLVFPSYLETFGLPLIEASHFGKSILCANEKYSQETINNYAGVKFIKTNNPEAWGNAIFDEYQNIFSYKNFKYENQNSWNSFFTLIHKTLKEN